VGAAKREDGVGAFHGPEHAGLFQAMADDGFAASFNDAGANEQMLLTERGIVHAGGIGGEVVGFVSDLFGQFNIGGLNLTKGSHEFGDLAFIQPTFLMETNPGFLTLGVVGVEQTCQIP